MWYCEIVLSHNPVDGTPILEENESGKGLYIVLCCKFRVLFGVYLNLSMGRQSAKRNHTKQGVLQDKQMS